MKKLNVSVRKAAIINGVPLYKVAELIGISESMLVKRMRKEWPEEEQNRVIRLIEEYAKGECNE